MGDNQTLMALWTVPAGYTAYLLQKDITSATAQNNKYATISLVERPEGEVFQGKDKHVLDNGVLHQEYSVPIEFLEKTDIEVRAVTSSGDDDISATLSILYVKDD